MSTKKYSFHGPEGLKYFLILSLLLHGALMWSILVMGRHNGWLAHQRRDLKKPEYVQVVELPPDYRVPKTNLKAPKKPKRYADRTSVVEKEEIPAGTAIRIHPKAGSKAARKSIARTPSRARKAAKKTAGIAKPRRIFKTKEGTSKGGEKAETKEVAKKVRKPARAEGSKTALEKEEKKVMRHALAEDGLALEHEKKGLENGKAEKTIKGATTIASNAPDNKHGKSGNTPNPGAGHSGAQASAPTPPSRPNLLLSDRRLSQLAREYQGSASHSKTKTLMLNTSELKYQVYLIELRHKIEQYWEYPRAAVMRGWEGKLFIDFTVKRDGSVSDIHLSRSSRYPVLDDAAITALKLAAPFTTFPKDFDVNEIKIHGQFVYNLINMPRQ